MKLEIHGETITKEELALINFALYALQGSGKLLEDKPCRDLQEKVRDILFRWTEQEYEARNQTI